MEFNKDNCIGLKNEITFDQKLVDAELNFRGQFDKMILIDKLIKNLKKLIGLRKNDYKGEELPEEVEIETDGIWSKKEVKSIQYEFENAYFEPKVAISTIIEIMQLEREIAGIPRINIITIEEAAKIRADYDVKNPSLVSLSV